MTDGGIVIREAKAREMPQIMGLWRDNKRTLGFLPEGAFEEAVYAQRLLIAVGVDGNLLGYLLYREGRGRCSIVHMCTSHQGRRQGVAKLLNDRLRDDTKARGLLGMGLYCRRDYDLSGLWTHLGYVPIHEKDGRSISGSVLTYWWLDHHQPDLFSMVSGADITAERTPVVIDANVLIRMHQEDGSEENLSAKSLAADWLQDQIEICVTEEVFVEIDRSKSKERRSKSRSWAKQHRLLSPTREQITAAEAALKKHFNPDDLVLETDRSDLNHLTRALAAEAPYLVTLDTEFLKRAADLSADIGIEVLDPATFVLRLDELRRKAEYAPVRLSGSQLQSRRVRDDDRNGLVAAFQASGDGESRPQLTAKLRTYLSAPDVYETRCVVCPQRGYLGLFVFQRSTDRVLTVPMFRFGKTAIGSTVARRVLCDLIGEKATVRQIQVTDQYVGKDVASALVEAGFGRTDDGSWVRMRMSGFCAANDVLHVLRHQVTPDPYDPSLGATAMPVDTAYRVETAIWPGKLANSPLPAFIVSIHPSYAMHLFDAGLARNDLLGAKPELALACENVYYRANQKCGLAAPARILWYVKQKKDREGTMTIRACSLLDEVLSDTPKNLYRQFKRLGVYEWRDMAAMVRNPARDAIMAFRFSHTESFTHPIPLAVVHQLGVKATFQSPARVPTPVFEKLYNMGMNDE